MCQTPFLLNQKKKRGKFIPSAQQLLVVDAIKKNYNVVVEARPGSGKTATVEAIVVSNPDMHIAVLTFSRRLRNETAERLCIYPNARAMTFHEMASRLFDTDIHNDSMLLEQRKRLRRSGIAPQWNYEPFECIVLDEIQDAYEPLFWIICLFIQAVTQATGDKAPRLVVLGDTRQSIYQFQDADPRFLTFASEILGPLSPYPWKTITFDRSFRLSNQCADFINNSYLGEDYIKGSKSGPKPMIIRCFPLQQTNILAKKLILIIRRYGARNTAILAPSIRNQIPLRNLVNELAEKYAVPIAVSIADENPLHDKVTNGKLIVSTIHQFKGSERDVIVLLGVDASYFKFFAKGIPDSKCPNEIFVALTRAKEQLVLIHNEGMKLMPFVSIKNIYETSKIINLTRKEKELTSSNPSSQPPRKDFTPPKMVKVLDIIRHFPQKHLNDIVTKYLHIKQISKPLPEKEHLNFTGIVISDRSRNLYEAVSDLNGIVVAAIFEHTKFGTLHTLGYDEKKTPGVSSINPREYISWISREACLFDTSQTGYWPRSIQMRDHKFDWIDAVDLERAQKRLAEQINYEPTTTVPNFEMRLKDDFHVGSHIIQITGQADIVKFCGSSDIKDKYLDSVWETKLVRALSKEHIVQVCIYAYLLSVNNPVQKGAQIPRIFLYNVRNGEKLEITTRRKNSLEDLRSMIERILKVKYTITDEISDEDFTETCTKARSEALRLTGHKCVEDAIVKNKFEEDGENNP